MDHASDPSSSPSFASSSYVSNGSSYNNVSATFSNDPSANSDHISLSKLSANLEKLVVDSDYDYTDAVIVVEDMEVGVHRCLLAARSQFFHELFKQKLDGSTKDGKPKYCMSQLVPFGEVGIEAFKVILNYLYTGKLKPSPPEVSTCVDETCAHDACGPAVNYAVELMYASATFKMKELVLLVQVGLRRTFSQIHYISYSYCFVVSLFGGMFTWINCFIHWISIVLVINLSFEPNTVTSSNICLQMEIFMAESIKKKVK